MFAEMEKTWKLLGERMKYNPVHNSYNKNAILTFFCLLI